MSFAAFGKACVLKRVLVATTTLRKHAKKLRITRNSPWSCTDHQFPSLAFSPMRGKFPLKAQIETSDNCDNWCFADVYYLCTSASLSRLSPTSYFSSPPVLRTRDFAEFSHSNYSMQHVFSRGIVMLFTESGDAVERCRAKLLTEIKFRKGLLEKLRDRLTEKDRVELCHSIVTAEQVFCSLFEQGPEVVDGKN